MAGNLKKKSVQELMRLQDNYMDIVGNDRGELTKTTLRMLTGAVKDIEKELQRRGVKRRNPMPNYTRVKESKRQNPDTPRYSYHQTPGGMVQYDSWTGTSLPLEQTWTQPPARHGVSQKRKKQAGAAGGTLIFLIAIGVGIAILAGAGIGKYQNEVIYG